MSHFIPPNATPVERLLYELAGPMAERGMAYDITWKYPEPWNNARRKEARARMIRAELKIEDIVRTWVENQPPRKVTGGTAEPSA
jgi:hypothetical protein